MKSNSGPLTIAYLGVLAALQVIDPIVTNIGLVDAGRALRMEGSMLALAASLSTLAQAATVLMLGFLGDRLGRRNVLAGSLLLAIAGNLIALAAPRAEVFLLGRALTGIALGGVLAASFAAVRDCCRPEQVARALGLWNLLIVVAFVLGSLVGGWLADSDWRLAMGLVPLICLLALPLLPALVPPMAAQPGLRADGPGLLTIAAAMVLTLVGVSHAVEGLRVPAFWQPTLAGLLLFAVHGAIESRRKQPIFPVALYRRGSFLAAIVSGIAWNFAQSVVQLQTSNFWQVVQHFRTSQVALGQLPLQLCFGVGGVVAGRLLAPGRRTRQLMLVGNALLVLGLLLLTPIQAASSYASLLPALVLVGLGLAFVAVPQSALFVQEAPAHSFGAVTAFRTTCGQLGFAMGFAASGALVNGFGVASLRHRLLERGVRPSAIPDLLSRSRVFLSHGIPPGASQPARPLMQAIQEAYATGLGGTMLVAALVVALLLVISLLLLVIGALQHQVSQSAGAGATPSSPGPDGC
jgi:MFS family permease